MDLDILVNNLTRRHFEPYVFDTKAQAVEFINGLIPSGAKVGFGGSMTVKELGLQTALNNGERTIYHGDFCEDYAIVRDSSRYSDWYVSSTNAVTASGEFVNIDGNGNRVAGQIFGSPNVLIVFGINKITADLQSAIERIRNVAAPPNAVRLGRKTPCAVTGVCSYCNSPDCMCNTTVILHHPTRGKRVVAVIIKESLGY